MRRAAELALPLAQLALHLLSEEEDTSAKALEIGGFGKERAALLRDLGKADTRRRRLTYSSAGESQSTGARTITTS
jgi:hypothetical protein